MVSGWWGTTSKTVSNQFHNANYAFAILTLRNAHCVLVFAHEISPASTAARLIASYVRVSSAFRPH